MYYGLEEPIAAPKVAIWDMLPTMLYISLLKDNYDKALDKMDKFAEKYGDFYSPLASDNARWNELTIGGMTNMLNSLELQGVDPFRSSEGIGAVNRYIRSANTDELKRIKASAPIYEAYMKEAAKLGDKYNPELEGLRSGFVVRDENGLVRRVSPNEWDSSKYGIFPYRSPIALESLRDLSSDTFKGYAQVQRLRGGADNKNDRARLGNDAKYYDIFGVTPEDQAKAVSAVKKALDNTIEGQFYRLQALKEAGARIANGEYKPNQFAQLADEIYTRDILEANADQLLEKDEINEFAKMRAHSNEQIRVHAKNARLDDQLARLREIDKLKLEHPEYFDENGKLKDPKDRIPDTNTGQSYVRDVYTTSIGKIFGVDMYRASEIIADGKAGKYIWERQRNTIRRYKTNKNGNKSVPEYNYDKIIKKHTTQGNVASNIFMMGVDGRVGKTIGSGNNKTTLLNTQFQYDSHLDSKKLVTKKSLISNAAGYGGKVEPNNISNVSGKLTVTDNIIGILGKNGVYSLWCEVLDDNGNSYCYKMGINSMAKRGGQYMSTTGTREQPLGLNEFEAGSRKQRDALATKVYTKTGSENNDAAFASDYETEERPLFNLYNLPWISDEVE